MRLTVNDVETALRLQGFPDRSDDDLNPGWDAQTGLRFRPAAVLCGLVDRGDGLHVVLTRRSNELPAHPGQISFPGGKVDPGDRSPLAAALREAHEEVGLTRDEVDVLGRLDLYRTRTGFRITPFVARVAPSWRPIPEPGEVEEVFEAPLDFLMDRANHRTDCYERDGRTRRYYAMPWNDYYIWGATAGMLRNLSDRLEAVSAGHRG